MIKQGPHPIIEFAVQPEWSMASHFVGCSTAPFDDNAAAEPGPLYFTYPGDMFLARLATSPSSLVFTDSGLHAGLVKRRPRTAKAIPSPNTMPAKTFFEPPSLKANMSPPMTIAMRESARARGPVNEVWSRLAAFSQGEPGGGRQKAISAS